MESLPDVDGRLFVDKRNFSFLIIHRIIHIIGHYNIFLT